MTLMMQSRGISMIFVPPLLLHTLVSHTHIHPQTHTHIHMYTHIQTYTTQSLIITPLVAIYFSADHEVIRKGNRYHEVIRIQVL